MKPIETAITRIFATDGSIVGLGFLITKSRIMTCAHVVADAVGIKRDDPNPPEQTIFVDFPLVDDNKRCTADIIVWLPSRDGTDDIAVLELNESAPVSTKPVNLVTVDKLWGAEFGVYGFPYYNPKGVWAKGKVSGLVEGKRIQIDALEGNISYFIEPGFSGSPVYSDDPNIDGVIGMAVSAESDPNIKAGFMIPSDVLLTKKDHIIGKQEHTDEQQGTGDPRRTPINMSDNKPQPVPHIWKRKMQRRVVYIGKFEEMQPVIQTKRVFVAHHFFGGDTNEMQDYRVFLKDGLEQIGYSPFFARDDSGTLLETICQGIINTEAGIYDVSGYNANVLIELGMSIGLNQPTIVIAQDDNKPLINPLQQLNPLRYADRYDLAERIGQAVKKHIQKYHQSGMSPRFCAACGLDCIARKPRQSPEDEYLLIGADPDKDKAIFFHLKKAVKNFNLSWQDLEGDFNLTTCQWVEEVKRCKIVFFHSKENGDKHHSGIDNAATMVRTGIAIGLGVAWRMILKQDDEMPTDLKGYQRVIWQNSDTAFRTALGGAVRTLLSEARPYGGMYDPLVPVELVEDDFEEIAPSISNPILLNGYVLISYHPQNETASKVAFELNYSLKKLDIETWIDQEKTSDWVKEDWNTAISKAIRMSSVVITVYTDEQANERSFRHEIATASDQKIPLIVVIPDISESQTELHIPAFLRQSADHIINFSLDVNWQQQVIDTLADVHVKQSINLLLNSTIKKLSEKDRKLVEQLAVFAEDADIPVSIIANLWQMEPMEVEDILKQFSQQSLVDFTDDYIRLYDVVRSFLQANIVVTPQLHARLLDAWDEWYSLPNEYAWRYYIYHAISAGRIEHAKELLQDARWLQVKLDATDVDALLADYAIVPDDSELQQTARSIEANRFEIESATVNLLELLESEVSGSNPEPSLKIFMSYARVDKPLCKQIVNELSEEYDVWYDQRIYAGQEWEAEILRAIEWCDAFVYLLSPESVASEYCQREYEIARQAGKLIFPVLIQARTEIPESLRNIHYADLSEDMREMASLRTALSNATRRKRTYNQVSTHQIPLIRVFLACSADVHTECKIARDVIDYFPNRPSYREKVGFRVVSWASPEGDADLTPQEILNIGLPKPSECDIVVAIFWSRMGTPFTDINGEEYLSGTHWELMDALNSSHSETIIFRRMEQPQINATDPDIASRIEQYRKVEEFFNSGLFYSEDGTLLRGVNQYNTPDDFRQDFEIFFEKLVTHLLKEYDNQ